MINVIYQQFFIPHFCLSCVYMWCSMGFSHTWASLLKWEELSKIIKTSQVTYFLPQQEDRGPVSLESICIDLVWWPCHTEPSLLALTPGTSWRRQREHDVTFLQLGVRKQESGSSLWVCAWRAGKSCTFGYHALGTTISSFLVLWGRTEAHGDF
jgi:hypothetical protein